MDEFELTYLAKNDILQKIDGSPFKEMLDIYLPASSKHPTLRIRKSGEKYEITKKEPAKDGDASHLIETTIPLTKEEFSELNMLKGKRVSKNRYIYKEGEYSYEVDVFTGDLKGLVVIDIEFKTNEEKNNFKQPSWVLAEITQEEFLAGGMVCGKNYDDLKEKLDKFGYIKI